MREVRDPELMETPTRLTLLLSIGFLILPVLPSVAPAQEWRVKTTSGKEYNKGQLYDMNDSTLHVWQPTSAEKETWDIILVSGQTYSRVSLEELRNRSLLFNTGSYRVDVPLEIITRIRSARSTHQTSQWHYLGGATSVLGGLLAWKYLSSTRYLSPSSAAGPFPPVFGGTVAVAGLLGHAKKLAKVTRSIDFDFSGMATEQKIQTVREIFRRRSTLIHFSLEPGLVTAIPISEIEQIRSVEMKRVGVLGLRHPFGPFLGALGGSVIGSGLSYWLGASTISGCSGVECWEMKRRLVAINGSLGAMIGYFGARLKEDMTLYDLSQMTLTEKTSEIAEIMKNETAFSDDEMVDVVYLKNGSFIKGTVTQEAPGKNVTIETPDGNTLVFSQKDIQEVRKDVEREDFQALKNEVLFELKASSIESRKNFDLFGFVGSYVATIGGYYALGGDDLARIVIPVVGPIFLLEPPQRDAPHTPVPFRQLLLAGSGVVQAGFLIDYLISTKRGKDLTKKYEFGVYPSRNGSAISVSLNF